MKKPNWFVYMIQTQSGKLYTGITTNLERRFSEHQSGKGGAKFFRSDPPQQIVYSEKAKNRSLASRREAQIKKMSHTNKEKMLD